MTGESVDKKAILSISLMLFVVCIGTGGYMAIEGWSVRDALFMTVITLATIGYGETHPLSADGRDFTILLIFLGLVTMAYVANVGVRAIFEGEWQKAMGRRKLENLLKNIKDHIIVCGYGRMGKVVCHELKVKGIPFVIIEQAPVTLDADDPTPVIQGDATSDEHLVHAGIARARGLVTVLSSDAHNLYVVLSARGLNATMKIVARASEEAAEQKLVRAGANQVVSPYHFGGIWMANMITKPAVVNFLEFVTRMGNMEYQIEEVKVEEGSALAGKSIQESDFAAKLGVIVTAVKDGGDMRFNPPVSTVIKPGDILVVIGETGKLSLLEGLARRK
ncbi:MAG: potassium channel protein [Nitrospinae bacterium]|nr:potassium channel protein [Nitrospinota bacterium]